MTRLADPVNFHAAAILNFRGETMKKYWLSGVLACSMCIPAMSFVPAAFGHGPAAQQDQMGQDTTKKDDSMKKDESMKKDDSMKKDKMSKDAKSKKTAKKNDKDTMKKDDGMKHDDSMKKDDSKPNN